MDLTLLPREYFYLCTKSLGKSVHNSQLKVFFKRYFLGKSKLTFLGAFISWTVVAIFVKTVLNVIVESNHRGIIEIEWAIDLRYIIFHSCSTILSKWSTIVCKDFSRVVTWIQTSPLISTMTWGRFHQTFSPSKKKPAHTAFWRNICRLFSPMTH